MEVLTKQLQIAELAAARPEVSFTSLNHYLDMDWMKEAYRRTRRESAPGVDEKTMEEYGKELESNLQELIGRAKSGRYHAPVISPILSNIYLHEVLDKWFAHEVKVRLKGRAFLVRYADDFVMGFECEEDAQRVYAVLPKRCGKYGLNLHPTKTRLIPFARPCHRQEGSKRTAEQGKDTFDFLGFTHYWGKTRKGGYAVKRKTASKRMSRSLKAINQWLQSHLHLGMREQWDKLMQKLLGHYAYYGITGNAEALERFREVAKRLWHKWLDRRSRRRGGLSWQRFAELLERYYPFPPARVVHSIYAAKS